MSLFTTRTYWEAKSGLASEEYDGNCLCVANVDNDATGQGGRWSPALNARDPGVILTLLEIER